MPRLTLQIVSDYIELSRVAAKFVARQILLNENVVLGLPAGETPLGMYRELVRLSKEGLLNLSNITTFNIDEYVGLQPSHSQSFHYYMQTHFFRHLNIPPEQIHIPDGMAPNLEQECQRYEEEIVSHGGIDLMILGIGTNGHIGYNEPGSDWGTTTRVVNLSEETRRREVKRFGSLDLAPTQAITMGIKTIMNARQILLLASGREKALAIKKALQEEITPAVPASILQLHPAVTVILDCAAASLLTGVRF